MKDTRRNGDVPEGMRKFDEWDVEKIGTLLIDSEKKDRFPRK